MKLWSTNRKDCQSIHVGSLILFLLGGCGANRADQAFEGEAKGQVAGAGRAVTAEPASGARTRAGTDASIPSDHSARDHGTRARYLARSDKPAQADADAGIDTSPLGRFALTYYWMASQEDKHRRSVQLYTKRCEPLAKVSRKFAQRLAREGTGQLHDGRIINVAGGCGCGHSRCYFVLGADSRWGVGVGERPLSPFRSVAVDPETVPIGTMLYIPELDGLTVPGHAPWGGFVHDGCVIADDRGGAIEGKEIDLYMVSKAHYQAFDRRHRLKKITVFDGRGRCERDGNKVVAVNRNST